jgi:hypothetical protein
MFSSHAVVFVTHELAFGLDLCDLHLGVALLTFEVIDQRIQAGRLRSLLGKQISFLLELCCEAISKPLRCTLHLLLKVANSLLQTGNFCEQLFLGGHKRLKLLLERFCLLEVLNSDSLLPLQELCVLVYLAPEVALLQCQT